MRKPENRLERFPGGINGVKVTAATTAAAMLLAACGESREKPQKEPDFGVVVSKQKNPEGSFITIAGCGVTPTGKVFEASKEYLKDAAEEIKYSYMGDIIEDTQPTDAAGGFEKNINEHPIIDGGTVQDGRFSCVSTPEVSEKVYDQAELGYFVEIPSQR